MLPKSSPILTPPHQSDSCTLAETGALRANPTEPMYTKNTIFLNMMSEQNIFYTPILILLLLLVL